MMMVDQKDLGDYKTAHGAAKAAGEVVKELAEEIGQKPDVEVTVDKRKSRGGSDIWIVAWPAGPHNWAVYLTGGEGVFGPGNEPELTGFYGHNNWEIECGSGHRLDFYPR